MVDGKSDSQDFQRLTSAMEVLGIKVGVLTESEAVGCGRCQSPIASTN